MMKLMATLLVGACWLAVSANEIKSLPRLVVKPCWKQWSGYLATNTGRETNLFYWYHEATANAEAKPVILWLNGGPGCSSLGGMFTELGPLVVGMDGNVTFNPFSWNKLANVLFLEQPAGVGFSYPNLPANDSTTADDTYHALLAFFAMHPELHGRPFYVMGESYGGHYVPNTVAAIEAGNAKLPPGAKQRINLIGFAVGNGYTDWQLDFNANVPNTRYHALTSQSRLDAAQEACSGDYARCFWPRKDVECPAKCDSAVRAAVEDAMDGSIDIYDIYEDVCLDKSHERLPTQGFMLMQERRAAQLATVVQVEERSEPSGGGDGGSSSLSSSGGGGGGSSSSSPLATAVGGRGDGSFGRDKTTSRAEEDHVAATAAVSLTTTRAFPGRYSAATSDPIPDAAFPTPSPRRRRLQTTISPIFPTCIDKSSSDYLNSADVQAAIHVRPWATPKGKWSDCGNVKYEFNYASELPNYERWTSEGTYQILIYNGDSDYILSHMGNNAWINQGLRLKKASEWTKWRGSDGQVAGYFEEYETAGKPLTFLTVKGAGHMVPKDRPRHALDMLSRFLAGGGYASVSKAAQVEPLCPA